MKAEVSQASTAAVAPGVRSVRKASSAHDGFHSVLGDAHPGGQSAVSAKGEQTTKSKADLHDWRQRGTHKATHGAKAAQDAKADASATAASGVGAEVKLDEHLARLLGKIDAEESTGSTAVDDADGANSDAGDATIEDHADDVCIPTQLKAEQTISAMMAMKPTGETAKPVQAETTRHDSKPVRAETSEHRAAVRQGAEGVGEPKAKVTIEVANKAQAAMPAEPAKPMAAEPQTAQADPSPRPPVSRQAEGQPAAALNVSSAAKLSADEAPAPRKSAPKEMSKPDQPARPQTEAAAPRGATSQIAASTEQPATARANTAVDADRPKDTRHEAPSASEQHHDAQPVAAKVSVVAQQAAPAPAVASVNATAIVSAIGADQARQLASTSPVQQAQVFRTAQPMRSLKIQLHPAELGMVTANLKAAGEQLHVELQVENHEAYRRLSADHDAIVKSLQSLGYDIDRVSIQQPQAVSTTAARVETHLDSGSFSRDASAFQSGNSGNGSERSNGQANGRRHGGDAQGSDQPQAVVQNRAGSGVYI